MDNTREKLIELIASKECDYYSGVYETWVEHDCEKCGVENCSVAQLADHLIANGVTLDNHSKWISVKERLPEPETDVIAFAGDYIDILSYRYDRRGNLAFMYMDDSGWWHERIRPSVTHWMPLPQPPKGE